MARLIITDPGGQIRIFEITGREVTIGRTDSNNLVLDHFSVSRQHARITIYPGGEARIADLGSTNGSLVNNRLIQEEHLKNHDRISLGSYEMLFEAAESQALHVQKASETAANATGLLSTQALAEALKQGVEPGHAETRERHEDLAAENKLLKVLLAVGTTLSSTLTSQEAMERVMGLVFQMHNVERGFLMLRDEGKEGFQPAVLRHKDESKKQGEQGVVLSQTLIERVMTERCPLLIHDVASDDRFASSASLRLAGVRSAMCSPLIANDKVKGLFYVDCLSQPYAFSPEELDIFAVIAAQAAISLDNAQAYEQLSRRTTERKALERFLAAPVVEKILANPGEVKLGGENQSVTILFSDIRGFTRMSESMAPADIVELLNQYFSSMTEIIFEENGTLDKYIGDAIMAIFGAPIARADDATRAVRTAIAMQGALAWLNQHWAKHGQPSLKIGIGINTGTVTAGNIGSSQRMDYTVIGDPVNLASRLCSSASAGQILLSDSAFRSLTEDFPSRKLDPIRVKGKQAQIEIHEILWADYQAPVRAPKSRKGQKTGTMQET